MKFDVCHGMLVSDIVPAIGCTEPASVAFAAATAANCLGERPTRIEVFVSEDFYRNGKNACIPGSGGQRGLRIAAAIGAIRAKPALKLELLSGVAADDLAIASEMDVRVWPEPFTDRVYVHVCAYVRNETAEATIVGRHDEIAVIRRNGEIIKEEKGRENEDASAKENEGISIRDAIAFAKTAPIEQMYCLHEAVRLNRAIAQEGLRGEYGIGVGRSVLKLIETYQLSGDVARKAIAVTAAAADARMAGCEMPVMSVAGSGNQGLTATLPVVVAAESIDADEETMLRALSMSALIAIHTKQYIGRLSALCGCGISAALGACAAVTYLYGGDDAMINRAINTLIADISGMVCDGAKPGCALKIATSVGAAFQAATLALNGGGAGEGDGIVCADAEDSLRNLGRLGNEAMSDASRVIMQMLDNTY